MGNEFGKTPLLQRTSVHERNASHHDRRSNQFPDYHERSDLAKTMHYFNHSKAELQYFAYRAAVGAFIGVVVGLSVVNPLCNFSPYIYRKILTLLKPTEIFPVSYTRVLFSTFAPQYAVGGAVISTLMEGSSWLYDFVIDSNKLTKYVVLGGLQGATVGLLFGNYGYWFGGALIGTALGTLTCFKPWGFSRHTGDYGKAEEYMSHVTDEEKRKHRLQEARLG
mmetsp:Transcript_9339/g.17920  ORF Transcript_9339/g.17920 Transcript_9339/m.17920 type:complete len:222 (+) Transcript_9339:829-1494(+)